MMRSKISWVDNVHFRGSTESGHEVAIDGPPDSGGQNRGARPMELMLLALSGCTSFDVVSILRKGRQTITGCEAEIEAERAEDDPRVFTRIHIHFTIRGRDVNPDKVQRAIELTAQKYCSASIMLERGGVAISHDHEIIDDAAAKPRPPLTGLRHVALYTQQFKKSLAFYRDILGMEVEWQPDSTNAYLTSGGDNLALHHTNALPSPGGQRLDHIGFILPTPEDVDAWYGYLVEHDIPIEKQPRTHRDGARSLYCRAPEGTLVQFIYHPPISGTAASE